MSAIPGTAQGPPALLLQLDSVCWGPGCPAPWHRCSVVTCPAPCPGFVPGSGARSPTASTVCAGLLASGSPGSTPGLELAAVSMCSWSAAGTCPPCGHWKPLGPSMLGTSSLPQLPKQCWSLIHAGRVGLQGGPQTQAPLQSDSAFEPMRDGECRCPILPAGHLPGNKVVLSAVLWSNNTIWVWGNMGIPVLVGLGEQ